MNNVIGIYRGSFDPPHLGHLETINCALCHGVDRVVVVYTDKNPLKPGRSSDHTRSVLLQKLFENSNAIVTSEFGFNATLSIQLDDPTVKKVRLIIGFDLLSVRFRPVSEPDKVDCLAISRTEQEIDNFPTLWNGLNLEIADSDGLVDRGTSSSAVRRQLAQNKLVEAKELLGSSVLESVLNQDLYSIPLNAELKKLVPNYSVEICPNGLSKDLILKVFNQDGEPLYIAKIFLDNFRFERELLGYSRVSELDLKHVRVPQIHYASENVIIMDFIEGKLLVELMGKDVDAVSLAAHAIRELHLASTTSFTGIPEHLRRVVDQVADLYPEGKQLIQDRWNCLEAAFIKDPGVMSVVHGDPNHFNWIVDVENEVVTYIDFSEFAENGFAMQEFYEADLCFWTAAHRVGGISKERLQLIRRTFKQAYFENVPNEISTLAARELFKGYWQLRVIESLLINGKSPTKEITQFMESDV